MRSLISVLSAFFVMALAYWAYQENYRTQDVLKEVRTLQRDIGNNREKLGVLRAEWAYLNRPDRLRELVVLNYGKLKLLPMTSDRFGRVDEVAYPGQASVILNSVQVSSQGHDEAGAGQ